MQLIGHKYYGIKRRKLFINSIDNIVYNNDNNYEIYKNKIWTLSRYNNINQFSIELILKPNIIISMFSTNSFGYVPLLYRLGRFGYGRNKIFLLFLETLFHFNNIILKNDEKYLFLNKYLNYNKIRNVMSIYEFVKCL